MLGRGQSNWPTFCEALCERLRGRHELRLGHEMRRESAMKSLITRHRATCEEHCARSASADLFHEPRRDDRGTDPKINLRIAKLRFRMRDREIADHHQSASTTDRGTLDARDGRNREPSNGA